MRFSIKNVASSLSTHLAPVLPGVTFLEDPTQQAGVMPCMFLQQRSSNIKNQVGVNRYLRTIRLDLTYLEDYNLPNLQELYQNTAEALDLVMDSFIYQYEEDGLIKINKMQTYDREWNIDLDALHYKFELRVMVDIEDDGVLMQELKANEVVHE